MTLTELVAVFKTKTGRLDLSDAEITVLINTSCKLLDEFEDSELRSYRFFLSILKDDYIVKLPDEFRYAKSATLHIADDAKVLTYQKPDAVRALIRDNTGLCVDQLMYSIVTGGLTKDFQAGELPLFMDTVGLQTQPTDRNLYLIVYPRVSEAAVIEVDAIAYTTSLSVSVASNYWSHHYPELVIQTTQYLLIKDLVNIDESAKLLKDIKDRILPISYDQYSAQQISMMEG